MANMATNSPLDSLILAADRALRTLLAPPQGARPAPAPEAGAPSGSSADDMSDAARRESANLMRVNHAGEIAAQALYHAQALFARDADTRAFMQQAAREEADHLAWCDERLRALGSRPSVLTPVWYAGSFAIGALAGLLGDKASLGFVAETERQVEGHLRGHLDRLPAEDTRSRAILEAMQHDEATHGEQAKEAGAADLPQPVKDLMRVTSSVMTATAYRI
jgi:ubiquinone biosynthesis monooxygenase Coq7